jgi:hypothetical protein
VGDEFFGILIWSIIIATSSNDIIDPECPSIGYDQKIRSSFGCTIWRAWIDRGSLGEESSIWDVSIDLVGRDMMKSLE